MEAPMSDFKAPEVIVGDLVFWYSDPVNPQSPSMGWISKKPGVNTVNILVWGESTGFVEKPSVRHRDDPFWKESESAASWQRWGCWEQHPQTIALKNVDVVLTKLKVQAAKKGSD